MQSDQNTQVELSAIKVLASASKTPFKTAFLATMGVAAAQLVVAFTFFGVLGTGLALLVYLARHL